MRERFVFLSFCSSKVSEQARGCLGIQAGRWALSLSLIPGQQGGGTYVQGKCFKLYMSLVLTSRWPKFSHVATTSLKRGLTRQSRAQLNPQAEREVVLLLKEREIDSWGRSAVSTTIRIPLMLCILFVQSTGFVFHRDYKILRKWASLCSFGTNEL